LRQSVGMDKRGITKHSVTDKSLSCVVVFFVVFLHSLPRAVFHAFLLRGADTMRRMTNLAGRDALHWCDGGGVCPREIGATTMLRKTIGFPGFLAP
jgi:hypothetical protein